ncbi:Hypothetical predicted protein [Paramuricea clavata]|uniref:Uncharacterized protein n=1 Tax=Paramuricea clavata TaxID=317549 RepID=A0A7D9HKS7_PARCT|nr:Hypothetical predicted protein [Paramuricea clavata]
MDQVDLLNAFKSGPDFNAVMNSLLQALSNANSASAAILALEGLFRIDGNVVSGQFSNAGVDVREGIRDVLRKWRCDSPLDQAYQTGPNTVNNAIPFLRSLTIFKTLEVPLFIDDFGRKRLMSHYRELEKNCRDLANNYEDLAEKCNSRYNQATFSSLGGKKVPVKKTTNSDFSGLVIGIGSRPFWVDAKKINIEAIDINLDTPIVHVTHTIQKDLIVAGQKLDPSDNKNSVKGIWFSREGKKNSVYGKWAFQTTLRKLGVSGIRQGEIVSYQKEVNFILYGSDTVPQDPVMKKATDGAVQLSQYNIDAYTAVSIFVPSRFLPQGAAFSQAFEQPYEVSHNRGFCVKARRSGTTCNELD